MPFGKYRNPDFIMEDSIRAGSILLRRLEILDGDFAYVVKKAKRGDLVYLDPPYQPISQTSSFTSYSKEAFGLPEQKRLRDTLIQLDKKGVDFVLSNSESKEIIELYKGINQFNINRVKAKRAINSNGSRRGEVGEVIIANVH